jgi:hypothetical protein
MKKLILLSALLFSFNGWADSLNQQLEITVADIKCRFISCPGDKDFTGSGEHIRKNGDRYNGDWKNGKFHGKGEYIHANGSQYKGDWYQHKRHGQGTYISKKGSMIGQFREDGFVLGYIYFPDGSIGFENYGQITPVRDSDKDISKQKKMEALLRASIRLNEMVNAPGYGNVTLGDYARILNEELSGRGGSRGKRKDTDWDWDYLKDSREWRCRGIQSGQFASNYNCRNDRKDDDRWPTK